MPYRTEVIGWCCGLCLRYSFGPPAWISGVKHCKDCRDRVLAPREPEWTTRARAHGLPAKDYTRS